MVFAHVRVRGERGHDGPSCWPSCLVPSLYGGSPFWVICSLFQKKNPWVAARVIEITHYSSNTWLRGESLLSWHVDDIIVTGNDQAGADHLGTQLSLRFEIKSRGKLKYFLGIGMAHSSKGIFIS